MIGHLLWNASNLDIGNHTIDIQKFTTGNYLLKIHIANQVIPKMITFRNE